MKVLISSCLIGENCKYNGGNNKNKKAIEFLKDKEIISVCPEVLAGMGVPRPSVEIVNGKIKDKNGTDLDNIYKKGVQKVLDQIKDQDIDLAILQSRSPTCGVKQVYDGSFTKTLIDGQGILAKALIDKGYKVIDIQDLSSYIQNMK